MLQGLLVEASPVQYERMAASRPGATCVHAAVCRSATTVHYVDAGPQPA